MTTPFDQIQEFITKYADDEFIDIEAGTSASAADIERLESDFGISFPEIYREYLSRFGTLEIGGIEFSGFSEAAYINPVSFRNSILENFAFSSELIPLENEEGDSYICIASDGGLFRWYPDGSPATDMNEKLDEYLLRCCQELIEDEGG